MFHVRGRCAWRMFSSSGEPGCVEAFAAYCIGDEEKARGAMDLAAEATGRPEPRRIRERADAIVGGRGQWLARGGTGKARKVDCEDGGWLNL
jgi:hypothetical protein